MKTPIIFVSFLAMFCLIGCSESTSNSSMLLVPPNAAKVIKSPAYKLEHTTDGGIKCYVRPLEPEIAPTITADNPDFEYLKGDDINPYYLLVLIRNDKIIDKEAVEAGALSEADQSEIEGFVKTFVPAHETPTDAAPAAEPAAQEPAATQEMPKEGENK